MATKQEKREARKKRSLERKLSYNERLKEIFADETLKNLSFREKMEKLVDFVMLEIKRTPTMKEEILVDYGLFMDIFWETATEVEKEKLKTPL